MSTRNVVILSGVRTAIGAYGGSLKDTLFIELAAQVVCAAVSRAGVAAEQVDACVFG